MKIAVRYFASVREALGGGEDVEVQAGADIAALRDALIARDGLHAEALGRRRMLRSARNLTLCGEDMVLADGDEVGFFPPLTGADVTGSPRAARVFIRAEDFDLAEEVAALRAVDGGIGAVVSFVGTVRDRHDGAVLDALELEHYPGMTEASIEAMIDEATRRFEIRGARVVHRVGRLEPLAQIVLVAVAAAHRGQAFQACEFLMDYLKTQAPFWKKESGTAGAHWVDARSADDAALARWGVEATNSADPKGA